MPTYSYSCSSCGKTYDKLEPITSYPHKKCQLCGKETVKRNISSGAGLIFKGSGFYVTDYKKGESK
jgi:putative FmdB family regulatory protein